MAQIEIKITIPDYEYENWTSFERGIEEVESDIKELLESRLRQDYIKHFDIEVTKNK